jgi:hypothetical protein
MKRPLVLNLLTCFVAIATVDQRTIRGQSQPPPDHPSITVRGQTYTPRSILAHNMGTPEDPSREIVGVEIQLWSRGKLRPHSIQSGLMRMFL